MIRKLDKYFVGWIIICTFAIVLYNVKNMAVAIQTPTVPVVSPIDALWSLFKSQPSNIRAELIQRIFVYDKDNVALAKKSIAESESIIKKEMLARLDELTLLPNAITEERAKSVDVRVAAIVRSVIEEADDCALSNWILFPDTNGAVSMDYRQGSDTKGNISIGLDGYSYYFQSGDNFEMKDQSSVDVDAIVKFINNHVSQS